MVRTKGKLFIIVVAIGFIALLCFICFGKCASRLGYHDFEVGGIYYKIVDDISRIVKVSYKGSDWEDYDQEYLDTIVIPEIVTYKHRNYRVTEIGDNAFRNCSAMTSISIPASVWLIGHGAFDGCETLKEIHINNLSAWCEMRFWDVVDDIGGSPFHYADELYLNGELITDLVVPEDVTDIGAHAFEGYEKLRSVVLHNGIEAIYKSAFLNCTNLTSINIPKDIYYVGPYAFDGTFWYDNLPDGEVYAGKHLYKYKGEMQSNTSIVVREGTETICESAFDCRAELTSITLPSSLRCIHDYAFNGCVNLKEIYFKGLTPPYLNSYYNNFHDDAVIYVPKGTQEIYKQDSHIFENVVEIF